MDPNGPRPPRRLLALAALLALVALAGCSDPVYSLQMTPVDDRGIADRYAKNASDLGGERRRVAAAAIANGSATAVGEYPPFDGTVAVRREGAYYELAFARDGEVPATRYTLEFSPADSKFGPGTRVDDLPEVDRDEFSLELVRGDEETVTGTATFADETAARSVLVGEGTTVVVDEDGDRIRVTVTDRASSSLPRYRYTARRIADSRGELADRVRERYLFELSDLPTDQRYLVENATREGEVGGLGSPPAAFDGLVERLRDHRQVPTEHGPGVWLVRYEGTVYWTVVQSTEHDFHED